ncbi:MAG: DUF433 domain-containing protein [Terriglobales bacterium]
MTSRSQTLTPTEAAVVSAVSLREVNRLIDEEILPPKLYANRRDRSRRFQVYACPFITFYFASARQLTSDERKRTIAEAVTKKDFKKLLTGKLIVREGFLTVDLTPFLRNSRNRLSRLEQARRLVAEKAGILGGTPVIRKTRIPVYDVAASVSAGISTERIVAAYSGLSAETVKLAALYAEAYPQRGRPSQPVRPPAGSVVVAAHRVPRKKLA